MHVDDDMVIDTQLFGAKKLWVLQGVSQWAAGEGSFDGSASSENWQVDKEAPESSVPAPD